LQCPHKPPKHISQFLAKHGTRAFVELSDSLSKEHSGPECPCVQLANLLDSIRTTDVQLEKGHKLDLRSLDSYDQALGEFSLEEIARLQKKAKQLVEKLNQLKRTPLVRELNRSGLITRDDVLSRPDFPSDSRFQGLFDLRQLARNVLGDPRKPKKPDYHERLADLYQFVRHNSGRWHDQEIADLLTDFLGKTCDRDALKQARYRLGLTDKPHP
jgi:hypothetical protein